jgi:translation initiation factor IF-3
VHSRFLF